jgi:hypothetical protein
VVEIGSGHLMEYSAGTVRAWHSREHWTTDHVLQEGEITEEVEQSVHLSYQHSAVGHFLHKHGLLDLVCYRMVWAAVILWVASLEEVGLTPTPNHASWVAQYRH